MIPTLTDLILAFCCSLVFTTIHTAIKNRKDRRNRDSRERQAKLEAFWKEEQLRLNPRAVLVDRLPTIKKYPEWDAHEQHLSQAERRLTSRRIEESSKRMMFTSNRGEDLSRQLEELKDFFEMTLPYPLLVRGKIIDTDMSLGQNYAPRLEGAEKIEALERRIKAYQESEMSKAVAVRNQAVKMLMKEAAMGMDVDEIISRADKIAKFILRGNVPKVGEPVYTSNWGADPTRELYGHDESTGEPIYADDDFHQDSDGILILTKNLPSTMG